MGDRSRDRTARVYVGGLNDSIKKEDLEGEFEKYGKLNSVWVAFNPPGFAFIEFNSLTDAETAWVDPVVGGPEVAEEVVAPVSEVAGEEVVIVVSKDMEVAVEEEEEEWNTAAAVVVEVDLDQEILIEGEILFRGMVTEVMVAQEEVVEEEVLDSIVIDLDQDHRIMDHRDAGTKVLQTIS
ncbi:unnamed protein product [Phyllotreta striolata]|uniref:RRM domain-containing protein n=1 Tax=Phyllotreta striolata TaxID=444603 RepID=A0A9N9XLI6_PHYSR|nr:unnamed protein product [Phyllotreta striolata]